jgi:hypothetical protein
MRETYCLFINAAMSGRRDREKPYTIGGGNRPLVRFCCVLNYPFIMILYRKKSHHPDGEKIARLSWRTEVQP